MLTKASPSTNCGLVSHCRRSGNSAGITPRMAGPPYAVTPILRKLVTISRIELHLRAATGGARLLVDDDRCGHILKGRARAVEHGDLVGARATGAAPDDHLGELCVHLLARQEAGVEHMLQLADLRTLLEHVDDQRGGGHERRLELLLAAVVRADRSDEGAGADVRLHHERLSRRCARHDDVAL